uniref:Uncharacterized protein n=1 Tax=Rhizophora mucronata TaxID=61149 RepID=A0A2P2KBP3_RHIMU
MYSSRGSNAYGQQSYGGQSGYGQNLGPGYSGSSVGVPDGGTQHSLASRHSSMLGGSQEVDIGGYRVHTSSGTRYGGQYGSVYGSSAMSGAQQVPSMNAKGGGPSALEGRGGYSSVTDSPKFASGEYLAASSHGYSHKSDPLFVDKIPDYSALDRRQYIDRHSAYMGRDIQNDPAARYTDSLSFGHQHQASLLRQEQLLKSQSMQSASLDGGARSIHPDW